MLVGQYHEICLPIYKKKKPISQIKLNFIENGRGRSYVLLSLKNEYLSKYLKVGVLSNTEQTFT